MAGRSRRSEDGSVPSGAQLFLDRREAGAVEPLELLGAAIGEARRLGRADLSDRLIGERDRLTSGDWHVLVAGEFKKGKSALVNALLGVPVCSADAVTFTAVPTIVRYAESPSAALILEGSIPGGIEEARQPIPVPSAPGYAGSGVDDSGARLYAVEVGLPRGLLRGGLVLIDTPGLGGGFAAAQAAATMRAMSLANAVVVVSDAAQEYTAAELDFLRHAAEMCPRLVCVLTKTDFYPQWTKIRDLDREHLRRAGLDLDLLPVSSALRELAVGSGDKELNAESGFPALAGWLRKELSAYRAQAWATSGAPAVRSSLSQLAGTLSAEHAALTRPDERPAALRRLDQAHRHASQLGNPSARWLNTLADRFADIQSDVDEDLQSRVRQLEQEATERIRAGDPAHDWVEIMPWLYQRSNDDLTAAHTRLLEWIEQAATEVAGLFQADAATVAGLIGTGRPAPSTGARLGLEQFSARTPGRLEIGMQAARGWSLSSSVITTVLVVTLHPGLLVILPVTAALGTIFAVKAARGFKTARLDATRNEAIRAVAGYLQQARADAYRAALSILRHSRSQLREYYLDRAAELTATAQQEQAATLRATAVDAAVDTAEGRQRVAQAAADLARVRGLLSTVDTG
jgi:Dynamin family